MGMSTSFLVVLLTGLVLIQAQDQSGFISIDCGAPAGVSYTEKTTGINYTSDANFIDTGVSGTIVSQLKNDYPRQMWNVRSFPEGKRNCYKINITKGSNYLIRATFLYGNYDGQNMLPRFDLLLGANRWDTVALIDASVDRKKEIMHVPSLDYIQICLVDIGYGTPFISAIELRTLSNQTYVTQFGSLEFYYRWDLGSTKSSIRYKDDVYDRIWYTYADNNDRKQLSPSISADSLEQNGYKVPAIVLSTAVTSANASAPLVIRIDQPEDQTGRFYVYMHFMEIEVLAKNQTREFSITLNGEPWYQSFSPQYLGVSTIYTTSDTSGKEIQFLLEMTVNSTLPPIINAIEIYKLVDFQQSDTFQGDVDAITTIKSVYQVTRDTWQGDPCVPAVYLWDGLNCIYGRNDSPRITTLDLSSSGLSGKIDSSISKLTMLEKLDLSNNSLNGEIPEFLSRLQHLKILNLEKNNLSGSVPSALKEGSISLSVDQNPYLCKSGQCNKKKGKNIFAIVVSVRGGMVLLMVAAIVWNLKRRKSEDLMVEKDQNEMLLECSKQDDPLLQFKKQIYSYSDVLRITNNFNTIIGKGGFGTVYLGYINGTPVAVKMLSRSSVHGYQQFQAEVNLLIRVHHRNLTSLVGYCNEGTNKGLIYEYMANGNLQEHLSGKHNKAKFLSWEDRLRIAVDAALGLEYLQKGCKPAIIHRDVKSTNILLNENLEAKLSDFGLSKIMPTDGVTHVSTVIAGTPGYLDPDYCTSNRLTEKSDVYSFGVVLLEIITCQQVIARNEEKIHISERVSSLIAKGEIKDIVDSRLRGDFDSNSAWRVVKIAMACISPKPNERPMMNMIVTELKESLATELARTKHINDVDLTRDTTEIVITTSMNLDTDDELTLPR